MLIYEGEQQLTEYNRCIQCFLLTNINPRFEENHEPNINVGFSLDHNGMLTVCASDKFSLSQFKYRVEESLLGQYNIQEIKTALDQKLLMNAKCNLVLIFKAIANIMKTNKYALSDQIDQLYQFINLRLKNSIKTTTDEYINWRNTLVKQLSDANIPYQEFYEIKTLNLTDDGDDCVQIKTDKSENI